MSLAVFFAHRLASLRRWLLRLLNDIGSMMASLGASDVRHRRRRRQSVDEALDSDWQRILGDGGRVMEDLEIATKRVIREADSKR
jgi:hypothetical protein